ncbi:MAG: hypothetical protein AAGE52_28710 [Myxococcota bacterium]
MADVFLLAFGAAVAATTILGWLVESSWKLKREILKAPFYPLREAPEGEVVRITGTLGFEGDAPLIAPISGRPCAAWHVIVWRQEGKSMRVLVDESESADFLLCDGDDVAFVDGTSLEMVLVKDTEQQTSTFLSAPTAELSAFLTERGHDTQGVIFRHSFRVIEGVLEEGERVVVVGVGVWEPDPSRRGEGYRDVGKRFRIGAMDDGRLLASDEVKLTKP